MAKAAEGSSAIVIQVVAAHGKDAYRLLRDKVTHEAETWYWANKTKTRLKHTNSTGYIEIASAAAVVIARVFPKTKGGAYFLTEKLVGRLVAWFEHDLAAMNIQFLEASRSSK